MLTIIISIFVFGLMIAVHEAGHLLLAKLNKVTVHEFSIGMGPKLFSKKHNETLYSLRLLPFGGFCNLEGEDEESNNEGSLNSKTPLQKISILAAGAVMNLILGYIAIAIVFAGTSSLPTTYVGDISPDSPAYSSGLRANDKIIKLNDTKIHIFYDIKLFLNENGTNPVNATVLRNNKKINLVLKPYESEGEYLIGYNVKTKNHNFFEKLHYSFQYELFTEKLILKSLSMLITGKLSLNDASGPVGIVKEIDSAAKSGFFDLLSLISLLSVNLGIFNLLPIPALDGGRIVFALFELIFRKKIPVKIEGYIHATMLMLLLLLMVFVTFNDISKLFIG